MSTRRGGKRREEGRPVCLRRYKTDRSVFTAWRHDGWLRKTGELPCHLDASVCLDYLSLLSAVLAQVKAASVTWSSSESTHFERSGFFCWTLSNRRSKHMLDLRCSVEWWTDRGETLLPVSALTSCYSSRYRLFIISLGSDSYKLKDWRQPFLFDALGKNLPCAAALTSIFIVFKYIFWLTVHPGQSFVTVEGEDVGEN